MNNTDPTKKREWIHVIAKSNQFLHPYNAPAMLLTYVVKSDNSLVGDIGNTKNKRKRKRSIVIWDMNIS